MKTLEMLLSEIGIEAVTIYDNEGNEVVNTGYGGEDIDGTYKVQTVDGTVFVEVEDRVPSFREIDDFRGV